jgi:hypothetical protein
VGFGIISSAPQLRRLSYTENAKPWMFRLPCISLSELTRFFRHFEERPIPHMFGRAGSGQPSLSPRARDS